jgi:hypothetical protein
MSDDYMYYKKDYETYERTLHLDGVRCTVRNNSFEISVQDNTEIWEQLAVQQLREWIKWRKEQAELRESRSVSGKESALR